MNAGGVPSQNAVVEEARGCNWQKLGDTRAMAAMLDGADLFSATRLRD